MADNSGGRPGPHEDPDFQRHSHTSPRDFNANPTGNPQSQPQSSYPQGFPSGSHPYNFNPALAPQDFNANPTGNPQSQPQSNYPQGFPSGSHPYNSNPAWAPQSQPQSNYPQGFPSGTHPYNFNPAWVPQNQPQGNYPQGFQSGNHPYNVNPAGGPQGQPQRQIRDGEKDQDGIYPWQGDFKKDVSVNNHPNRTYIMSRQAQQEIRTLIRLHRSVTINLSNEAVHDQMRSKSHTDVTSKGSYEPDPSKINHQNPGLYLQVTGQTRERVKFASNIIDTKLSTGPPRQNQSNRTGDTHRNQPPVVPARWTGEDGEIIQERVPNIFKQGDTPFRTFNPEEWKSKDWVFAQAELAHDGNVCKVPVGLDPEALPDTWLLNMLLGQQSQWIKWIKNETGVNVTILGYGSRDENPNTRAQPLHFRLQNYSNGNMQHAAALTIHLINRVRPGYESEVDKLEKRDNPLGLRLPRMQPFQDHYVNDPELGDLGAEREWHCRRVFSMYQLEEDQQEIYRFHIKMGIETYGFPMSGTHWHFIYNYPRMVGFTNRLPKRPRAEREQYGVYCPD